MILLTTLQTKINKLKTILQKTENNKELILLQLSISSNNNSIKKITELDMIINKLRKEILINSSILMNLYKKENKLKLFLKPLLDAGFIIYDDGIYTYTAQQFKIIKLHNMFVKRKCCNSSQFYKNAEIFFCKQRISFDAKNLPGNYDLISENHKKCILSCTNLRTLKL